MNFVVPIRSCGGRLVDFHHFGNCHGLHLRFSLISCIITPRFLQRVGHACVRRSDLAAQHRAFCFCALMVDWRAWLVFRCISGFGIAGAYLIIESWLNERVTNETARLSSRSIWRSPVWWASIGGIYLAPLGDPSNTSLFILCGVIFALAMLPTALSTAKSLTPIHQAKFDLPKLYRLSPIAFIGSLLSGAPLRHLEQPWRRLYPEYRHEHGGGARRCWPACSPAAQYRKCRSAAYRT